MNKYKQFIEETGQLFRFTVWNRDRKIKKDLKQEKKE